MPDSDSTSEQSNQGVQNDDLKLDEESLRLLTKLLYDLMKQEVRIERERLGR
jgi:hypothetical protein